MSRTKYIEGTSNLFRRDAFMYRENRNEKDISVFGKTNNLIPFNNRLIYSDTLDVHYHIIMVREYMITYKNFDIGINGGWCVFKSEELIKNGFMMIKDDKDINHFGITNGRNQITIPERNILKALADTLNYSEKHIINWAKRNNIKISTGKRRK